MERAEKQLIKAFWLANIDELSGGEVSTLLIERAYNCGSVVDDYHERIEGLGRRRIFEGAPSFIASLNEDQLLGCIAYHFRADYFEDWHFEEEENVLSLQRYVLAWLVKVSDLPIPPVDTVAYTFTSCGLNSVETGDFQRRVAISIYGEVKITECYVAGRNRHAVKGTTETRKTTLEADTTLKLLTALCSLEDLKPGELIDTHSICDAFETIRFKSKGSKAAKEVLRPRSEQDDSFVNALYEILDELELDDDDDDDED